MRPRSLLAIVVGLGVFAGLSVTPVAQGIAPASGNPVGTWLLDVTFLSSNPPPFKEILTLHAGGTVSETNASLSSASGFFPPPFNLIGSDGQGRWGRQRSMVHISFVKMVFCGPASAAFCAPDGSQAGQHRGYLRVDIRARVSGHRLNADAHEVSAVLYLGPEPEGSGIDFGPALVTGRRLL